MRIYSGQGLGDMYYKIIRNLTECGHKVHVKGQGDCLEFPEPVILEYFKPGNCWMRIPGRRFNPFFMLAEIVWILSGNGNVEWISYFNSRMKEYSDGNDDFHGAYGLRMRKWPSEIANFIHIDQIEMVVNRLKKDPHSRRAVICLWDPERDNVLNSRDYPCNNIIYYKLREEVLEQTVVVRSNDLVWGTPHNAIQFSNLQALVAGMLGVRMGKTIHMIQNLHYYLDLYKPTLANLIERAYSYDENPPGVFPQMCSESLPHFGPILEEDFKELVRHVNSLLAKDAEVVINHVAPTSSGYVLPAYCFQILDMLKLFVKVKTGNPIGGIVIQETLSNLEQPLRWMVEEFYQNSNNPVAQQVVQFLRRNNDVTA